MQSGATDLGPFLAGLGERQETLQEGPGFWFWGWRGGGGAADSALTENCHEEVGTSPTALQVFTSNSEGVPFSWMIVIYDVSRPAEGAAALRAASRTARTTSARSRTSRRVSVTRLLCSCHGKLFQLFWGFSIAIPIFRKQDPVNSLSRCSSLIFSRFIYYLPSSSVVQARTPKAAKPGQEEEEAMDATSQADAALSAERWADGFRWLGKKI